MQHYFVYWYLPPHPHFEKLLTPLMSIRFFFSKLFLIKLSNYFEIHIFFKVKVEPTFIIEFDLENRHLVVITN